MREKFTQNRRGLLFALTLMIFALVGGKAYAQTNSDKISSLVMTNGTENVNLLAGNPIEKLIAEYDLKVELQNVTNVGVLTWEVDKVLENNQRENIKSISTEQTVNNGIVTFWIPSDYKLFTGETYEITFKGWVDTDSKNYGNDPVFNEKVYISGGTAAYVYSNVTLVDPNPSSINSQESQFSLSGPSDNTIRFTYSGPVQNVSATIPLGQGAGTVRCEVALDNEDKTVVVTIPDYILSSYHQFTLNVYAFGKDNDGAVRGNSGEEASSAWQVSVDADFNLSYANAVFPAKNATVGAVTSLKFAFPAGILDAYTGNTITITNENDDEVASSVEISNVTPFSERDNWDYIVNEVIVSLDNAITTPGTYTVNVPKGVFNLDQSVQGFSSEPNHAETYTFTVAAPTTDVPENVTVAADPAIGPVTSLSGFTFTFNGVDEVGWTGNFAPTISYEVYGWENTYSMPLYTKGQGGNLLRAALFTEGELTDAHCYTVVIPVGAVYFNGDVYNVNTEPYTFKYEIETPKEPSYTVNPTPGVVSSLKEISVIFDDYAEISWGNGNPYIKDANENTYKLDCTYGIPYNEGIFTLKEEITELGTYTLVIPAGAVTLDGTDSSSDITFTWTIKAPIKVSVNPTEGPANSLSEITVTYDELDPNNGVQTVDESAMSFTVTDLSGNTTNGTISRVDNYPYNTLTFVLADTYTADGTYTLTIPANSVKDFTTGLLIPDVLVFTWTIGKATATSEIFAAEGNVEIYDAKGMLVKSGDASVVKTLAPNKMYIINGKKVIIRK